MDHDELDHLLVPRSDDIVDRKYRVRERLGTGGMGIVFRVEHVHTGRTYALKVLGRRWPRRPRVGGASRPRPAQSVRCAILTSSMWWTSDTPAPARPGSRIW